MRRTVEPEWLDALAPDDPRAVRSRRDLERLNAIMRSARHVARALSAVVEETPRCLLDVGSGDGKWLVRLADALGGRWSGLRALLLDRRDAVSGGTLARLAARGWRPEVLTADAADWLAQERSADPDVIVANLFLHHFHDDALETLLASIARSTRVFAACEPRRSAMALEASRLVGFVGCGSVTRHDAPASVRAGFAGRELTALWPAGERWRLEEKACGWFGHLFVAARCR